jgi:alpha-L-glutamate ligase-like protein
MFKLLSILRNAGVLSMNMRNADFISKYNPRKLYPLVDDKLKTKELAIISGVPVPELYNVIKIQRDVALVAQTLATRDKFVVKPSRGSGGEGIMVLSAKSKNGWRKNDGMIVSQDAFEDHITRILSGVFSLGGQPDKALIEYRVEFDPVFEHIAYLGVPDIRIIVFLGVPVMAMVRLPTRISQGKANLHQGAVGAGIDIKTGKTTSAVWKDMSIEEHPDTGYELRDVLVPHWSQLLIMASKTYELTGLGYQGVDFVLDGTLGPMLLELNARPGLAIQIANMKGLYHQLRRVEKFHNDIKKMSPEERAFFV